MKSGMVLWASAMIGAFWAGFFVRCSAPANQTAGKVLQVSAHVCEQIMLQRGRTDVAALCAATEDLAPVLMQATQEQQCALDAGGDR